MRLAEICAYLESLAPPALAEEWDNVGLLAGDPQQEIQRVMTCLTVTPVTASEAIRQEADLVVSHHPFPFRPVNRLTPATTVGRLLWELAGRSIAIYSPHTAWDSARGGINQQLAVGLGLEQIRPLRPCTAANAGSSGTENGTATAGSSAAPQSLASSPLGSGRWGCLPAAITLGELADRAKDFLDLDGIQYVGDEYAEHRQVAVACGSAGSFLEPARLAGCTAFLVGETSFHTCLEAEAQGIALLLPGHFASERFALIGLADLLQAEFPTLDVWASVGEQDPLQWR